MATEVPPDPSLVSGKHLQKNPGGPCTSEQARLLVISLACWCVHCCVCVRVEPGCVPPPRCVVRAGGRRAGALGDGASLSPEAPVREAGRAGRFQQQRLPFLFSLLHLSPFGGHSQGLWSTP